MQILGTYMYLHFTCLDSLKKLTKSKTLYAKLKPFSEHVSIEGGDCFFQTIEFLCLSVFFILRSWYGGGGAETVNLRNATLTWSPECLQKENHVIT